MTGTKLECPACEMILVTPKPVAAGTLVKCPRCGACFGVPALSSAEGPMAEPSLTSRSAPPPAAVPQGRPVMLASAVAPPAPAAPMATPAAVPVTNGSPLEAQGPESLALSEDEGLSFPDPRPGAVRATSKKPGAEKPGSSHRGKKKKNDPAVVWLLAGSAVALLAAGVIVVAVIASSDAKKKHQMKNPAKEAPAVVRPAEKGEAAPAGAAPVVERKEKAAARAMDRKRAPAAGTDRKDSRKDKAGGAMKDDDAPRPIPGLAIPAKPETPSPTPPQNP